MESYWRTIRDMLSSIGGFLTAITPLAIGVMAFYQWRTNKKVTLVHKEMNGMKDALVKGAGELGEEKGKREATAKAKIEIDKLNKDSQSEK